MKITKDEFEGITNLNFGRCITVGELIKVLQKLDPDSDVTCDDNAGGEYSLLGLSYYSGYVTLNGNNEFKNWLSRESFEI